MVRVIERAIGKPIERRTVSGFEEQERAPQVPPRATLATTQPATASERGPSRATMPAPRAHRDQHAPKSARHDRRAPEPARRDPRRHKSAA